MSRRGRAALVTIALVAFALRVWWAGAFAASPPWLDPDGYSGMSRLLVDSLGWHWTRRAVQFAEFKGVERTPLKMRIQDRGAARLQLRAQNVDAIVDAMKAAGLKVASQGGTAVPIPWDRPLRLPA